MIYDFDIVIWCEILWYIVNNVVNWKKSYVYINEIVNI